MTPERIAEIEDALRSPGFGLAGIERHELLHLLRCAKAVAELQAWLHADARREVRLNGWRLCGADSSLLRQIESLLEQARATEGESDAE